MGVPRYFRATSTEYLYLPTFTGNLQWSKFQVGGYLPSYLLKYYRMYLTAIIMVHEIEPGAKTI